MLISNLKMYWFESSNFQHLPAARQLIRKFQQLPTTIAIAAAAAGNTAPPYETEPRCSLLRPPTIKTMHLQLNNRRLIWVDNLNVVSNFLSGCGHVLLTARGPRFFYYKYFNNRGGAVAGAQWRWYVGIAAFSFENLNFWKDFVKRYISICFYFTKHFVNLWFML